MTKNISLRKFEAELENNNYDGLGVELRKIAKIRNPHWPRKEIVISHQDEDDRYFWVKNCTPLFLAAMKQDTNAIQIINETLNLKNPQLFDLAIQNVESCLKKSNAVEFCRAHTLLLLTKERYFPDLEISYSKSEKDAVGKKLKNELNLIKSIPELLAYYEANITKNYLQYHRHFLFDGIRALFQPHPIYTRSKISFIEGIQTKAISLLKEAHDPEQIASLKNSSLFNPIHYQRGAKTLKLREIMENLAEKEMYSI